jgi:7-cyano-7-deazaguanine synthase
MKYIVLLSGGMDSRVLLEDATQAQENKVLCLGFDYGQKHYIELDYAKRIALKKAVPFKVINLCGVFGGQSQLLGGLGSPVVENRNACFLHLACAVAESGGYEQVLFGANKDDYEGFPDCRPEFVERLNQTLMAAQLNVRVVAPYQDLTKREIAQRGKELGVDFSETMSCYSGVDGGCGKCDACKKREVALCGL